MTIIKCDMCEKEIKNYNNRINQIYTNDSIIDLCKNCCDIYENVKKEIESKTTELRKKYHESIKEETQKIYDKYKINIKR